MPLYEYHCETCQADFELLVQGSAAVQCPHCKGVKLVKQFSTFAAAGTTHKVGSGSHHTHTPSCGCGRAGGSCEMMN